MVLPECALLFGGHESLQLEAIGNSDGNELKQMMADLANEFDVYLLAGTIPARSEKGRIFSRSYLFDLNGNTLGKYDKLHLFDVEVADGTKNYKESDTFCHGEQVCVIDTPIGKIGLAICYDLRFPELFQALRSAGAELIVLPSAFTRVTGESHWQVLLQARAIETQCFILAAAQWGQHPQSRRQTWGQSAIVDPWGKILAQRLEGTGWVQAQPDLQQLNKIRQQMPLWQQKRFQAPKLKKTN